MKVRISPTRFYIGLVLLFALAGRFALLEYTDLTDPTESRYSTVAEQMVLSGNWLTPMLPMPEGIVPYLGKPPLHFWLTALSYKLFGIEEWTSRLPSFLGTLLLAACVFSFAKKFFGRIEAWATVLVFLSSGMTYVIAGASVTDVTLALMVTLGAIFTYRFISSAEAPRSEIYLAALCAGLGFLVKGPVALVLIGLPILLWSTLRRDFSWMRRIPWIPSIAVFLITVAPWFILNELKNPGFIHYFIWNENIARYLFKDYGDRYGSGHLRPHGMSWLYLALAYLPWTLVLPFILFRLGRVKILLLFRNNSALLFLACWAFISPFFFTFVRQLHMLYIYPAIAPLSILTAVLIVQHGELLLPLKRLTARHGITALIVVVAFILVIFGAIKTYSNLSLPFTVLVLGSAFAVLKFRTAQREALGSIATTCLVVFSWHLLVLVNLTPFLNIKNSSQNALVAVAEDNSCQDATHDHLVGVFTQNTFSHYWTAGAWESELPEKMTIKYVAASDLATSDVCYFLLEASADKTTIENLSRYFTLKSRKGDWMVYARNEPRGG